MCNCQKKMFAKVERLKIREGSVEVANNLVQNVIIPVLEQQPGFICQLLLSDPVTGKGISINLWENECALANFQASPVYKEVSTKISDLLISPSTQENFLVGAKTM